MTRAIDGKDYFGKVHFRTMLSLVIVIHTKKIIASAPTINIFLPLINPKAIPTIATTTSNTINRVGIAVMDTC
jgi:hypothetical protein